MFTLNNQPKAQRYTVKDFRKQFPTDDVCLEWLKNYLYPDGIHCTKCDKVTPHYKVKGRKSYSCQSCGHHIHPTADTIYHKSSTPLTDWFYAVYLMASTRCGISAKQLERELGVTYKTAWRMFHQIRSMLAENGKIGGEGTEVEVDESYVGGRKRGVGSKRRFENKTPVVGAVERDGSVIAKVVPNIKKRTLIPFIKENVEPDTTVYTDENQSYVALRWHGYKHDRVNHSKYVWVKGDCHTNSIEGFWSLMKGGIRGVYKHVDGKYVQNYVNEYAFRYNRRNVQSPMFLAFLEQVEKFSD
jgi:transposase